MLELVGCCAVNTRVQLKLGVTVIVVVGVIDKGLRNRDQKDII